MTKAKLSLEQEGDGFVLTKIDPQGQASTMHLTDEEVLILAQSAPKMQDRVIAKHTPVGGGRPPVSVVPVGQLSLNTDAHHTEIHMQFLTPSGSKSQIFGLPAEAAKSLLEALPKWIAKIEAPKSFSQ